MEDLDELLAGLDKPRQSTRSKHRTPSAAVNYDELNELMLDLASPSDTKASQPRAAPAPVYSSQGSDSIAREPVRSVPPAHNQSARNTPQPVRSPPQQAVRNTQSAVQLDDLDELLRNLGPPSATHAHSTPPAHNQHNGLSYDRQSTVPVRNVARPAQQQASPAARSPVTKPTGRVIDGPDLDVMLADINKTSTRDLGSGGPGTRGDCAQCRKPILGEVIQALNRMWHPEHFVCGNCNVPLGTSNFYEQDGAPNCESCYQELFCSRCAHCDQPITDRCITALNRKWHHDHFICAQCLGPFPGGTFFEKEGRPYCEGCFHTAFSSRCAGCSQSIKGECINALGQQWHPEHFVCQYCQKSFGTGSFYEYGGKPYCETHYHQQTGSLCAGCGKAVTGRMVNALDKKWHPEHFVCSFCMQPLAGGAFTENAGKAYCKECHGKLFG